MTSVPPSPRTRVRRESHRGAYDRATIDAILDATPMCHLAFVHDGQPYAVPTLHARVGDTVYVHGSAASRALRTLGGRGEGGLPGCVTVSLLDGLVLARSVFEHSVNYRSVMLLGTLVAIAGEADKRAALRAFTETLLPGRWAEARQPTGQELAATTVLALPITEASAKVRTGGPGDGDSPDADLPIWAGVVPLSSSWGEPEPDPLLAPDVALPPSVHRLCNSKPSGGTGFRS
jgi:nitroimidazol reductase NimA-like FMN-containing flavoprotein (pyridoxamine 5'-phosphate oxidase superfamily)